MKKRKFIVGDCFEKFTQHSNIISLSKFKQLNSISDDVSSYEYVIGQGVSSLELNEIKMNQPAMYNMITNLNVLAKEQNIVHKRKVENCHITRPVKITETDYTLNISIDSKCCEISDHVTGEHINGIILIEAARQAFIAVTELYFLAKDDRVYFILKNISCQFESFLFPLTIDMKYKILNFEKKGHLKMEFEVEVIFYHHEEKNDCVIKGFFSVYPKLMMENLESELANNAIESFSEEKKEIII